MKDIFPGTYEYASGVLLFDWEQEFDFSSAEYITQCINELIRIQQLNLSPENVTWVVDFSKNVLNDIVNSKSQFESQDEKIVLNYIQFIITIIPLNVYSLKKDLQTSYDWIAYSFCDDLSSEQVKDFEVGRIVEYMSHPIIRQLINPCMITKWISDFYYVCRCFSAMPNVAKEIWQWSQIVSIRAFNTGCLKEFSYAWSNLACWAANNHDTRISEIVEFMENVVSDVDAPDQLKCDFLICLSTIVGDFSSKRHWEWAQLAIDGYSHLFKEHQKLQMLLDGTDWSDDTYLLQNSDAILHEIERLTSKNMIDAGGSAVELLRITDRLVVLIGPFLGHCIQHNKGEFAISLLRKWYSCDPGNSIDWDKLLFLYPNHITSMKYLIGGQPLVIECKQSEKYESMMETSNKFLGISTSVGMAPDFELYIPATGRFGVPDAESSNDFEMKLARLYELECINEFRSSNQEILDGFISIPSHQHPIQYLTNKYLSEVWPHSVSLEKPCSDREVVKVCMWCGANSITEEIEYNAVNSVFSKYGIDVDYFPSDSTTINQFKDIYQSDEYDLIWVMSHGDFDHWKPGEASFEIGSGESITLDEILKLSIPSNDNRRLLFLNVCDGATYVNLGGLPKIGFAPALSCSNQCVVSHLWPVNPWAAALFGVLFAINISKRQSYFEAYSIALKNILLDIDELHKLIEEEVNDNDEFLQRLMHQNIDFKLMAHSGSATFFQ